ncbi:1,4-dihydroxy-2-naphthoate octaprenyltransferase [Cellulophaga baltica]|uniref:1,4-dihydroxy-2-naphthoate octaprenyltransferase n=1 Tax=Cellulophaga TaxID=104264 RepID=UPI001C06A26B|nr:MULTISPECIES: 1,4-dihydroxy-2-naphthoate octaprenyltransferase [Cellulophaga]MBU2996101.1 1,4-dihydroxy-2-naphthoate octaprenyltransferase [Cellulophaga baltica]MDO6767496.1 1,4-dihydroxy-2-naphthoate octaprenyltransferase [Cellulophaga sp. 1_MG-2023]
MIKLKAWVNAARLRTLPLSISGIIVGVALAHFYGFQNWLVFTLAILTTISFQVTSNFANDYGDGVKGTDNDDRVGPKRALQSGILTQGELKKGILISVIIDIILAIVLLYTAFGIEKLKFIILFLGLALLSIWAAIKYTVGDSAYGYKGLGDIFVFLFFGLLAVLGSMFLFTNYITLIAFLPAITVGLLSAGVLNLNNLRDVYSDTKAGKNTIVVKMGYENGKIYHYTLLGISFLCMLLFSLLTFTMWFNFLHLLVFIPIGLHALRVKKTKDSKLLDPELKKLALSTFFLALTFYISYNIFS